MAYATTADLEELGLGAAAVTELSEEKKEALLRAASQLADGYLGSAYALPLTNWNADLTLHVVSIAVWLLMSGPRGFNPDGSDQTIRDKYTDAINWLKGVAAGRIKPVGIVDSTPDTFEGGSFVVSSAKRGW